MEVTFSYLSLSALFSGCCAKADGERSNTKEVISTGVGERESGHMTRAPRRKD